MKKLPENSLFFGISAERVARLRNIRVGGRPLFDENGEVSTSKREESPVDKTIESPAFCVA